MEQFLGNSIAGMGRALGQASGLLGLPDSCDKRLGLASESAEAVRRQNLAVDTGRGENKHPRKGRTRPPEMGGWVQELPQPINSI